MMLQFLRYAFAFVLGVLFAISLLTGRAANAQDPDGLVPGGYVTIQAPCAQVADVEVAMKEQFGEVPVSYGYTDQLPGGAVVITFVNAMNGTFTVMLVSPEGMACMVAEGNHYLPLVGAEPPGDEL